MILGKVNQIASGVAIIACGCGAALFLVHRNSHQISVARQSAVLEMIAIKPQVHTAAWYVAHPDILKQDEQRCAGDAATLPQAACQNVASADAQVAAGDFAKAAAKNGAIDTKTPNAP